MNRRLPPLLGVSLSIPAIFWSRWQHCSLITITEKTATAIGMMLDLRIPLVVVITAALLVSNVKTAVAANDPRRQPNIIFILGDDLGFEKIGAYGAQFSRDGGQVSVTPQIDALAAEGVRFSHAYATPYCTPSRNLLLTGRYLNRYGPIRLGQYATGQTCYAELLQNAGYRTAVLGKWQLSANPQQVGFHQSTLKMKNTSNHWFRTNSKGDPSPEFHENGVKIEGWPNASGDYVADYEYWWMAKFMEENRHRPFLIHYNPWQPHVPEQRTPDSPDRGGNDTNANMLQDMMLYLDKTVGRLLSKLEELGLREDTMIIFTGDNGSDSGMGQVPFSYNGGTPRSVPASPKHWATEFGCRVPLIVSWPGRDKPGRVVSDLVDFSDVTATMLHAAGAELPSQEDRRLDGVSFLPQIMGKPGQPREWVFLHHYAGNSSWPPEQTQWVRDKQYKLYRIIEGPTTDRKGRELHNRLVEIESDIWEDNLIAPGAGTPEQEAARTRLNQILDQIDTYHGPAFPALQ